ncbi:MAG: tRNA ligase subunit PheS family protein, partial [Betaproteobacteria bacterium]
MQDLDAIVNEALALFSGIERADQLEQAKARYLGRSGTLTELLKGLGKLPAADRPAMGSRINAAKAQLEAALETQRERIRAQELNAKLAEEKLDVTLPGRGGSAGGLHPVTRTMERVEKLFRSLGFEVADGPEIETDYYNFTALNQPENHPARSMHDTFYLADGKH